MVADVGKNKTNELFTFTCKPQLWSEWCLLRTMDIANAVRSCIYIYTHNMYVYINIYTYMSYYLQIDIAVDRQEGTQKCHDVKLSLQGRRNLPNKMQKVSVPVSRNLGCSTNSKPE